MIGQNSASITAASLIRDLERLEGALCATCGVDVCAHAALLSIAIGFKDAVRCLTCLAHELDGTPEELGRRLFDYIEHRDCFRGAWEWACGKEATAFSPVPECAWRTRNASTPRGMTDCHPTPGARGEPQPPVPVEAWDAGDLGCGELVLELRVRLQRLPGGEVFRLTARDPGAPEDLPAWCRLTGHALERAEHPVYWIRRKTE